MQATTSSPVRVSVPAKINLALIVSDLKPDGYHEVATVLHAISLHDEITAEPSDGFSIRTEGDQSHLVPDDDSNLALKAARLLAARTGVQRGVALHVRKRIPVAGGMAGGSADAAGALVACDALWRTGCDRDELAEIAAELGSDVPFGLMGGTAVGRGRGDQLTAALARGNYHWVIALAEGGLSTPAVYGEIDRLRKGRPIPDPEVPADLMQALRSGDARALGRALHNDLQPAAVNLMPTLAQTLEVGISDGALGAVVSGSGPSVAFLVEDAEHGLDLSVALAASGVVRDVVRANGPVGGARLVDTQRL